jgi:hypothetical protein
VHGLNLSMSFSMYGAWITIMQATVVMCKV